VVDSYVLTVLANTAGEMSGWNPALQAIACCPRADMGAHSFRLKHVQEERRS